MGKFLRLVLVGLSCASFLSTSAFAQYSGSIYGPVDVDNGNAVSGLAGSTAAPTQNGNIRYQWRIVPTTAGDNRWQGFEWDSRTKIFGFIGNPTFTPNNNVIIDGGMDIRYNNNPGNFRINSIETGKRYIYNITDVGNNLANAPGDDQIAFALTEINHSASLVTTPDGANTGLSTVRSGNNIVLQTSTTAENSGSNEELWYQWTHDGFTTKNFVEDEAIAANETTSIALSSTAPILREGDTLQWLLALTGPSSLANISATTRGLVNFDVIAINKSTLVSYSITDDDTTAPAFTGFSVAGKTDAEILAGGWSLSGNIQDTGSGVNENSVTVTGNDFTPNYDLVNVAATAVVDNRPFATRPSDGGAMGSTATLADTVPAVAAGSIDLGTYTVRASATDNDEDPSTSANDRTAVINSTIATFTVTDDDTTAPVLSAFSIASKTDGEIVAGGWTISGDITDAGSGVNNNGATVTTDNFSPNFDIMNNANTELAGNQLFTTRPADGANGTVSASAPGIAAGTSIDLGTYKVTVSATDNDEDRTAVNDRQAVINSQVATFTVTDDDTSGPVHSSFTGNNITLEGASYLDTDLASGLDIDGLVQDAQSGVAASPNSTYSLSRNGTTAASGSFNTLFSDGQGVGSPVSITVTIPKAIIEVVGTYVLTVTNFNYDIDRGTGDRESTVNQYTFTVTANNPLITVQAGTLAFGSLVVNTTSAEQSYTVSGINLGADPIVITAPSGFQVSTTSGSGFGSSLNLTPSGGTVNNTTIYARFVPNNVAAFSPNITHTHTSATTQNKAVTGTGTAPNDPASFSAAAASSSSITLTFSLSAQSKPVTIVRDTDNTFSTPSGAPPSAGNAFAGGTVVYNGSSSTQTDTGLSGGTIYYYKAFSYDAVNGNFYSAGLSANATTIPAAPVAIPPASTNHLSFTALWNASSGAASYRLDVAYDSSFSAKVSGYDNLTVGGTSQSVTVPYIGMFYYRVRAVNASGTSGDSSTIIVGMKPAQGRNSGGAGSPNVSPGTLYVGDTATMIVDTWGTINGDYGRGRVWLNSAPDVINGGVSLRGPYSGFDNNDSTTVTTTNIPSAGTWYWGVQMDYGGTYGTNNWLVRNSAAWHDLSYSGTNADLTITVLALGDPTGVNAVKDGSLPAEKINLTWTKWNSRDVLVVRSLDNTFTAPTPAAAYIAGNTIGGDTVVYKGAGTSFADTGLSAGTTYYYKYYSENNRYYSDGVTDSETTDAALTPDIPTATEDTGNTITGFTANWDAASGATSYRLDVARDSGFTSMVITDSNVGNVTTYNVTGQVVGQYYYRVRAVNGAGASADSNVIAANTTTGQSRNKDGVSPPYYRNISSVAQGTIYVGDTITVGADLWGQVNSQNGTPRAVIHTTTTLRSGLYGSWGSADSVEYTEAVTPKFTSAGTWYWGIQMSYGTAGTNFWHVRNDNNWTVQYFAGTNATIAVTVTALGDPTSPNATANGQNQIDLTWAKWVNRDVMIVRSTDNTFGTPAANYVYTAGETISGDTVVYKGSGTSFSSTGLGAGTTYYYKLYSENYGYYSAGTVVNATTTGTAPDAPADQAATLVTTTSFQANWSTSANATGYRLDVANDIGFTSILGSYNNLDVTGGNVTFRSVTGLTAGNTYYYRVRAYNGAGTSGSSATRTVTLPASSTIQIQAINETGPNSGDLEFTATVGASYDVYSSDDGGSTWNPVTTVTANSNPETVAVTEDDNKLFKVVIAGASAGSSPSIAHGVIEKTIPAGYSMMSAPLDYADLSILGTFGTDLKAGLADGTQLYIADSSGVFSTTITLVGGNWNADYTLAEGQAFYVNNAGGSTAVRFDESVGNNGITTRTIYPGPSSTEGTWNLLGLSQGITRTFASTFSLANFTGTPSSSYNQRFADKIAYDSNNDGVFEQAYLTPAGWRLLASPTTAPSWSFPSGAAVYYLRYGTGPLTIKF